MNSVDHREVLQTVLVLMWWKAKLSLMASLTPLDLDAAVQQPVQTVQRHDPATSPLIKSNFHKYKPFQHIDTIYTQWTRSH